MDDGTMTPGDDDAELVARIARGEPQAESSLWHRFRRATLFLLREHGCPADAVEDLYHDTYIIVLRKLRNGALEDPRKLSSYVQQTARYLCIGRWREEQRHRTDGDPDLDEHFPTPFERPQQAVQKEQVSRAVAQFITEMRVRRDRDVLRRHYLLGQSKAQVCHDLDLTETHYDRVISRARKRLAELLLEQGMARDDLRPWLDEE